jgi:hypothetical protein
MNTVNPVQFYPRHPGLNLDPGSTNSLRTAPLRSPLYIFLCSVGLLSLLSVIRFLFFPKGPYIALTQQGNDFIVLDKKSYVRES